MQKPRTFLDKLFLIIKGLGMGAANKVPGVSGGIVAFVAGFYEEFIYSLRKINLKAFKLLFNGRFKSFYRYVNGQFLSLLIFGMLVSYFSVSKILDYFLEQQELFVWATFFGMIIGSIYFIANDFKHWNRGTITAGLLGFLVGISISFLSPAKENDNLLFIFLCGIISVSGMTLPGLSGSFILILLGNYVLLLVDSVNSLYDTMAEMIKGDFSFIENQLRLRTLKILAVFTMGSATGLVTLSHLLGYVLKHYKHITSAVIVPKFHFSMARAIKNILANTSPKKKDHSNIGWLAKSQLIILAKEKTLMKIPKKRASKKLPLIALQKGLNPSFCKVLNWEKFMPFMEVISSS